MSSPASSVLLDQPSAPARLECRRLAAERGYLLPLAALVVAGVVCAWFATCGDWNFFTPQSLGVFYDAQAISILNGHLDVPKETIGFEAFIVNGKYFGYFGIGPALLRIPLLLLFQGLDGLWSRLLAFLASFISLLCAYRILRETRGETDSRWSPLFDSVFLIAAGIGSTSVFLVARSFVFHEAILWAGAFALLCACALIKYLKSPSVGSLVAAGGFAFMSLHSRPTAGAGAVLALIALTLLLIVRAVTKRNVARSFLGFVEFPKPQTHAVIGAAMLLLILASYLGVNYGKFGTLSPLPLQYYGQYLEEPARMQVTGARQIHLENLLTGIATYFGPDGARFESHFPWVYLSETPVVVGQPSIDVVEGFSSFPVSMPALTLLALVGVVSLFGRGQSETVRRLRLPALALAAGGSISLMTVGITERYLHDLFPALILCSAVGLTTLCSGKYLSWKFALIALLTLVSVACNTSFALVYQRTGKWGVPAAKQAEFDRLREKVDAWF